jgi:hypothetical protein
MSDNPTTPIDEKYFTAAEQALVLKEFEGVTDEELEESLEWHRRQDRQRDTDVALQLRAKGYTDEQVRAGVESARARREAVLDALCTPLPGQQPFLT